MAAAPYPTGTLPLFASDHHKAYSQRQPTTLAILPFICFIFFFSGDILFPIYSSGDLGIKNKTGKVKLPYHQGAHYLLGQRHAAYFLFALAFAFSFY